MVKTQSHTGEHHRIARMFQGHSVCQAITYDGVLIRENIMAFEDDIKAQEYQRVLSVFSQIDEDGAGAHGVFSAIKWAREQCLEEGPVTADTLMPETTMQKMTQAWLSQHGSS